MIACALMFDWGICADDPRRLFSMPVGDILQLNRMAAEWSAYKKSKAG